MGLVKPLIAKIDRADPQLIRIVEEAIEMNRLFVKKTVVTVKARRGKHCTNDGPAGVIDSAHSSRPSGRASISSMDEYDTEEEVDIPASCEVTLDGILISERGGSSDSGLLITRSRRVTVSCLHPNYLLINVPLEIGSPAVTSNSIDSSQPLQKQPSIRWLGKEQGELFEHTSATIQEHHTVFEKYLRRHRRHQERKVFDEGQAENDFIVAPGGFTKLTSSRGSSSQPLTTQHILAPEQRPNGAGVKLGDLFDDEEEGVIHIDAEEANLSNQLGVNAACDANGFVLLEGKAAESTMHKGLSEESLHALRREEMEKMIYKEVSLSLSSHGGDSSHEGSVSGDDDENPFAVKQGPKHLTIRVLCQDRTARDALVLSIRTLVSETPSLPTQIEMPNSSPTVLLTEEQRKALLPWRQMEESCRGGPQINLPIMHGTVSSPTLDICSREENIGEAELNEAILNTQERLTDLKSKRQRLFGVSDPQSPESLELLKMSQVVSDQREKIGLLMDELKMVNAELIEKDAEIAKSHQVLEEERNRFVADINELQAEFNNLEAASIQKEKDMLLEMERNVTILVSAEENKLNSYQGKIESLSKELEKSKLEVSMLSTKFQKSEIERTCQLSPSTDYPEVSSDKPAPDKKTVASQAVIAGATKNVFASLIKDENGELAVDWGSSTVFNPSKLEFDVLRILIGRWQKNFDAVKGIPGVIGDEDSKKVVVDDKVLCLDMARLLSKYEHRSTEASPGDIAGMLDSIIFSEHRSGDKTPSFDAVELDDAVTEDNISGGGFRQVLRPPFRPRSGSKTNSVDGMCSPSIVENISGNLSRSRDMEENLFLEISCALNDILPPSEDSMANEEILQSYQQSQSNDFLKSSSRDGNLQKSSSRMRGYTPPLAPSNGDSCVSGRKSMASPGQKFSQGNGPDVRSSSRGGSPFHASPGSELSFPRSSSQDPMELKLVICRLENDIARSEEVRRTAAAKLPELMCTYQEMKEAKEIALGNMNQATKRIAQLTTENEGLRAQLSSLGQDVESLKEVLETKRKALKESDSLHSDEVLKLCKENQEISVKYHTLLRDFEDLDRATTEKIKKLNEALVMAEASSIDLSSQCTTDSKLLLAANATIEQLEAEITSLRAAATDAESKMKLLEKEVTRSQKEANGLQRECARLRETVATVQRNSEPIVKLKQDMATLQQLLAESEGKNSQASSVETNSSLWETEKKDLMVQLDEALERALESENRVVALENELLVSSDNRQALSRQKSVTDEMTNQIKKLRQRLLETDQEVQAIQALLSAKQEENTKLASDKELLEKEVETLRNTLEKRKSRIEKLKIEAADCKILSEQSARFEEERARFKGIIDSLDKDRKELYALRPQMAKLEAANAEIKYQRDLLSNETKRQNSELSANSTTIQYLENQLLSIESMQAELRQELETMSMHGEDLRTVTVVLADKYVVQQSTNDKLKEDLHLAYTADPIRVKTLNFMLAKLQGDKNHWENKVKRRI